MGLRPRGRRSRGPRELQALSGKWPGLRGRGSGVHPKVLDMLRHVRAGYALARVEDRAQGGVRIHLRRGAHAKALTFEHFDVPAVLQECTCVGVAK